MRKPLFLTLTFSVTLILFCFCSKWKVPPPCGTYRDCADKDDGDYADIDTKCTSYYTCANSYFFGHSLCPAGMSLETVSSLLRPTS